MRGQASRGARGESALTSPRCGLTITLRARDSAAPRVDRERRERRAHSPNGSRPPRVPSRREIEVTSYPQRGG